MHTHTHIHTRVLNKYASATTFAFTQPHTQAHTHTHKHTQHTHAYTAMEPLCLRCLVQPPLGSPVARHSRSQRGNVFLEHDLPGEISKSISAFAMAPMH